MKSVPELYLQTIALLYQFFEYLFLCSRYLKWRNYIKTSKQTLTHSISSFSVMTIGFSIM